MIFAGTKLKNPNASGFRRGLIWGLKQCHHRYNISPSFHSEFHGEALSLDPIWQHHHSSEISPYDSKVTWLSKILHLLSLLGKEGVSLVVPPASRFTVSFSLFNLNKIMCLDLYQSVYKEFWYKIIDVCLWNWVWTNQMPKNGDTSPLWAPFGERWGIMAVLGKQKINAYYTTLVGHSN